MYYIGIEAFLAVVENGSISKAADILNLSQSSVSYRLKTLENELGFKLVERSKGIQGIELTKQGYSFLSVAEKTLALQKETEKIKSEGNTTTLTVGTADSISLYLMTGLYKGLLENFRNIRPFILTQHTIETYNSIKTRGIDIGFVKRDFAMPNVKVQKMMDEEMVLVRYGDPENCKGEIEPKELQAENEIFMDWGYTYQIWHDYWWKPQNYTIRVDAADLIFEMLDSEQKWAIVPRSIFDAMQNRGPFYEQDLKQKPPGRGCYMIRHKYIEKSKQDAIKFIEGYCKEHFKE